MRDHSNENKERIQTLAQEVMNSHVMVSIVKTRLDEYLAKANDVEEKV